MKTTTKAHKVPMQTNSYSLTGIFLFFFFFFLWSLSTYFRVNWSIKTYLGVLSYQLGHWCCNVWRASMLAITDVRRLMIVVKIRVPLLTWEYTVSICWNVVAFSLCTVHGASANVFSFLIWNGNSVCRTITRGALHRGNRVRFLLSRQHSCLHRLLNCS